MFNTEAGGLQAARAISATANTIAKSKFIVAVPGWKRRGFNSAVQHSG
jgi:hypothetical protein